MSDLSTALEGFSIQLERRGEDLGQEGLWTIEKDGIAVSLSVDCSAKGKESKLLYEFAEAILRRGDDQPRELGALLGKSSRLVDAESRLLRKLRNALELARPERYSLPRLLLQLASLEGHFASTEERIWNALNVILDFETFSGGLSLEDERRVVSVATTPAGKLKGGSSCRIATKLVSWLELRSSVEGVRRMYKPLPWIFRHDSVRVSSFFVVFVVSATLAGNDAMVCLGGTSAWIWIGMIMLFVASTLLSPVLFPDAGRMRYALRPGFRLRLAGLVKGSVFGLFGGTLALQSKLITGGIVLLSLFLAILASWVHWWVLARGALLCRGLPGPVGRCSRQRANSQLALHFEEALACAFLVCFLRDVVLQSLGSPPAQAKPLVLAGIATPRVLTLEIGSLELNLYPAFVLAVASFTMLFAIITELSRSRRPT